MAQAIKVELCNVGTPRALSLEGDAKENWRRFEEEFRAYLAASGDKTLPENMKVPMLLNVIGRVGKKLYRELQLSEDDKWKLPIVLRELERKVVKKNVVYERFLLHTRKQSEGESFDSFVKDLRFLVRSCQYGDLEESILRDHVVFGIQDRLLQQRLLQMGNLDLEAAIQICRSAEATRYQPAVGSSASEMEIKLEDDGTGEMRRRAKICDTSARESFTTKFEECYLAGGNEGLLDDTSVESLKMEPVEDDPPLSPGLTVKLEVDLQSTVERMVVARSLQEDCYQGLDANVGNLLEQPLKSSEHWHRSEIKKRKTNIKQLVTKSSLRPHKQKQRARQPHKCETCSKSFKTKSNLNHHLLRHKKVHHCNICSKSFLTKEFLTKHMIMHNATDDSTDLQSPEGTLKCDVCNKGFVSKYSLKDHMLAHLGKQPHECEFCGKSFSKLGHFKEHVLIHKGVRPFQCGFCNKGFSRKWYLNQHMLAHEVHRPFQCEMCRKAYKNKFNLMKHLETHSNEISIAEEMIADAHTSEMSDGSYHCDICNKKFALKNNLTSHILVHLGKQPHECELCNKRFLKKGHLKKHMTTYHQMVPQYECTHCDEIFPSKLDLKQHSTIHKSVEDQTDLPFRCEICKKGYSNAKILKWHSLGHTQGMNHKCEVCEKTFTRVEYLRKHQKSHYSSSFSCEVCGNSYRFSESLARHMRSHGPQNVFEYECDICKKKFNKLVSYNRHLAAKHKPREHADKFQCDTCSKILTNKQGLELHMRTHTGEKPHQCHICSQCFSQRGSLNIHLLKHTGEKPHSCTVCGKGFQTKEYIKKHMLIHTGDLPHSCEICNKRFTVKSNLNKHMMSHKNKQLIQCKGCKIFVGKDYLKMHLCAEDRPYQCDKCEKKFTLKDYLRKHMHTHKKK